MNEDRKRRGEKVCHVSALSIKTTNNNTNYNNKSSVIMIK